MKMRSLFEIFRGHPEVLVFANTARAELLVVPTPGLSAADAAKLQVDERWRAIVFREATAGSVNWPQSEYEKGTGTVEYVGWYTSRQNLLDQTAQSGPDGVRAKYPGYKLLPSGLERTTASAMPRWLSWDTLKPVLSVVATVGAFVIFEAPVKKFKMDADLRAAAAIPTPSFEVSVVDVPCALRELKQRTLYVNATIRIKNTGTIPLNLYRTHVDLIARVCKNPISEKRDVFGSRVLAANLSRWNPFLGDAAPDVAPDAALDGAGASTARPCYHHWVGNADFYDGGRYNHDESASYAPSWVVSINEDHFNHARVSLEVWSATDWNADEPTLGGFSGTRVGSWNAEVRRDAIKNLNRTFLDPVAPLCPPPRPDAGEARAQITLSGENASVEATLRAGSQQQGGSTATAPAAPSSPVHAGGGSAPAPADAVPAHTVVR